MENMASLCAATSTLQSRDQFVNISVGMLEAKFEVENTSLLFAFEQIREKDALSASAQPTTRGVGEGSDDEDFEVTSSSPHGSPSCCFARAADQLSEELQLLMAESHGIGGEGRGHSLLSLVDSETRMAKDWLRSSWR